MKRLYFVFGLLGLAGIAVAQAVTNQFSTVVGPQDFKADIVAEQRLSVGGVLNARYAIIVDGGITATSINGATVYNSIVGSRAWDFPELSAVELGTPCALSGVATLTGTRIGDRCSVGITFGADGGADVLLSTATLVCRAVTNGAVAQLCVHLTDGGSYDIADAGYVFQTWH